MTNITKFEAGKQYTHGWIGDSSLKTTYTVIRRTAKSVWIDRDPSGKGKVKRIYVYNGVEHVSLGNYSMAPQLGADDLTA